MQLAALLAAFFWRSGCATDEGERPRLHLRPELFYARPVGPPNATLRPAAQGLDPYSGGPSMHDLAPHTLNLSPECRPRCKLSCRTTLEPRRTRHPLRVMLTVKELSLLPSVLSASFW